MSETAPQCNTPGCGRTKVFLGVTDNQELSVFVCPHCDGPDIPNLKEADGEVA